MNRIIKSVCTGMAPTLAALALCGCAHRQVSGITGGGNNTNTITAQATTENTPTLQAVVNNAPAPDRPKKKIKIALLLDTSNSMDGLIDQARAQLWKLVNELSLARAGQEKPELEIALYEYGNSQLAQNQGYIRQVSDFSSDLDSISEQLFALRTNGGEEYCGYVISSATGQLKWENDSSSLKLMFIAGNEPFTQGSVSSSEACRMAGAQDIIVNTIYCGDYKEGLSTGWFSGAQLAMGSYMNIDQDKKTVFIETPFDGEIAQLNDRLNETYIYYGTYGESKKQKQITQDNNAKQYGASNMASRAVTKSGKFYKNESWDLVDAKNGKGFDLNTVKDEQLPKEMRGKTREQKEQYISQKAKEREAITKQIQDLNVKRNAFIAEKKKAMKAESTLDAAMIKAIREQAARKKFVFES